MQVLAHLTIRIFEITCPQNSQGSTWRVGSDSSPQSFSPQKVRLESYDFCQWILSASGRCDMGHGITKRHDVTLIYYKVCITLISGVNIYYIHNLPHLAPKNRDLQGPLRCVDHA